MGLLDGKVAVITGAGSGMGRAMCILFAKEGAKIAGIDYAGDTAEATAKTVRDAGGEAIAFQADISKREDIDGAVTAVIEAYGKIDVLCNNAGVFDGFTPVLDVDDALWDRVMGINAKGMLLCSQRVIPEMLKQGKGAIVNTASVAGLIANGGGIVYTASKHAAIGITKQLAAEFSAQGIRVNCFCPGGIKTGMTKDLVGVPEVDALVLSGQMIPRWGEPEEMANIALFLASDMSSFVTGAAYTGDAGMTAK